MKFALFRSATETPAFPATEPPGHLEPPLSPVAPQESRRRWPYVAGIILLVLISAWAAERWRARERGVARIVPTAVVVRGEFVKSIRLAGTMEALESHSVIAPVIRQIQTSAASGVSGSSGGMTGPLILTELDRAGTRVKNGDVVARFDPQSEVQNYIAAKADYQALLDQVAAKKADEAAAKATDDSDLTQAEDALKKAQLEMLKNPILSPNDVKTNQLALEEAEATLKQLKVTYALKRQSAAADIRDYGVQAEEKRLAMIQAAQNERAMVIRAPADGIVVIDTHWTGNTMAPFEVGDNARAGTPFMKIVNPARMEALLDVNQMDAPYIRAGAPAVIHLDAYPGASFPGAIESISPIANASDFSNELRTLSATARVTVNDPRLMPDLSAAVDAQLLAVPNALLAPRDAILRDGGNNYVLLKTGARFTRRAVKLGPMNDTQAVIESGLRPGEVVERDVNDSRG